MLNFLHYLNISKASGHDGISNKILKIRSNGIYKPLTRLTNLSLFLGQYPSSWKLANGTTVPLFKSDYRQFKTNYRSISLLVCLSKICEKVVFLVELYNFLDEIGFFHCFQSVSRPGDSTVMQMIYILNKIYNASDKGCEIRVVFLDTPKLLIKFGIRVC